MKKKHARVGLPVHRALFAAVFDDAAKKIREHDIVPEEYAHLPRHVRRAIAARLKAPGVTHGL